MLRRSGETHVEGMRMCRDVVAKIRALSHRDEVRQGGRSEASRGTGEWD
jgi:hypothetical protein